jgi:hypothetical protein
VSFQRSLFQIFPLLCLLLGLCAYAARGDDAEIEKQLAAKGAMFGKTKDVITRVQIADCSAWNEADFQKLTQLTHLQDLDFSSGLTDQQVTLICTLPDVASIQTNKAQVTDDGVKTFAKFGKLRVLKFFHPHKAFTGVGLAQLADMPGLKSLTVAGSDSFADAGMAAVGKLRQLEEFRCWHAGNTPAGVAKLKELAGLKRINLGQRLAYKPPAAVSDETIATLVEMKSLESLQLSEARLKLAALVELKHLPHLKILTLDGIDMPESDVEQLKKELPMVQIKWTRPTEAYVKRIKAMFGGNAER